MLFDIFTLFIVASVSTFAVERLTHVFFVKRRTTTTTLVLSYLPFLFMWSNGFPVFENIIFINHFYGFVILYILSVFIITLNYESSMTKRIFAALCAFLLWEVSTATIAARLVNLYAILFNQPLPHGNVNSIIASAIYCGMAILLTRRLVFIKRNNFDFRTFVGLSLVITIWTMLGGLLNHGNITFTYFLISVSVLTGFVVFLLLYLYNSLSKEHEDKLKTALHSQEKEYYFTQCQLMQESVENTKSIRHDMQLHLATARDFITNNKSDEAENYLNSLIGDIDKNEIYSNTKNTAFDSIINFKLNYAKQENIKLDLRLLIPTSLNIELADIVIIIGNLLDNALDAVSKVEEKRIKLDIEYSRESLFIQIENTFDGTIQYAEETGEEEKRIITRKDGGEHGHGLKNIRKSVEKYNGHFDIAHEGNTFSAVVLLYVDVV